MTDWKSVIAFKQNEIDPGPKALEWSERAVSAIFKYAEHAALTGGIGYLAFKSKDWSVTVAFGILAVALAVHLQTLIVGFTFFNWRQAPNFPSRTLFWFLDSALFLFLAALTYFTVNGVIQALVKGFGAGS